MERKLRVLTIAPKLEQKIIENKASFNCGSIFAVDSSLHHAWIKSVSKAFLAVKDKGFYPVILCSEQARFLVRNSICRDLPELAVLSVHEIAKGFFPELLDEIRLPYPAVLPEDKSEEESWREYRRT